MTAVVNVRASLNVRVDVLVYVQWAPDSSCVEQLASLLVGGVRFGVSGLVILLFFWFEACS